MLPDGSSYKGTFKNNLQDGVGTFMFTDGRKYVGHFKDNMFEGEGELYRPDSVYLGEFLNN